MIIEMFQYLIVVALGLSAGFLLGLEYGRYERTLERRGRQRVQHSLLQVAAAASILRL
jgi:NhaP-type Na+/H+ or K+/H+ antiporter